MKSDLAKKVATEILKSAASFPGRGWGGKTEHIDEFLQSAYEFMTPSDKDLKDKVFHAYYRHYNDGDFKSLPYGTLKKLGMSEEEIMKLKDAKSMKHDQMFQKYLEKALDVTQKYLYKKYKNAVDRRGVTYKKLTEVADAIKSNDYRSGYWIEKFGKIVGNNELVELAKKLEALNKGINLVKDLKDLPDEDVIKIRRIVREELEKRKPTEQAVAASKTAKEILAGSYSDFLMNNRSEITTAIKQMRELQKIEKTKLTDEIYNQIEDKLAIYDRQVQSLVEHYMHSESMRLTAEELGRVGIEIMNQHGTEMRMVLQAIEDVYFLLSRKGLIDDQDSN